jgi:hypothetical protein
MTGSAGWRHARRVAAAVVFMTPEYYRPHTSPGVYVPTVVPLFSTVGAATPWAMMSGSQFRPAPPPALNSETWTRDLNEIREIGRIDSTKRTAEQTTIGRFWLFTGPRTYNPIVRTVTASPQASPQRAVTRYMGGGRSSYQGVTR